MTIRQTKIILAALCFIMPLLYYVVVDILECSNRGLCDYPMYSRFTTSSGFANYLITSILGASFTWAIFSILLKEKK